MRMVPDIPAHADPETGYRIFVGGQPCIVGGTSAATALYAGFVRRLRAKARVHRA